MRCEHIEKVVVTTYKCDICGKEQDSMAKCSICKREVCHDCGDFEYFDDFISQIGPFSDFSRPVCKDCRDLYNLSGLMEEVITTQNKIYDLESQLSDLEERFKKEVTEKIQKKKYITQEDCLIDLNGGKNGDTL